MLLIEFPAVDTGTCRTTGEEQVIGQVSSMACDIKSGRLGETIISVTMVIPIDGSHHVTWSLRLT